MPSQDEHAGEAAHLVAILPQRSWLQRPRGRIQVEKIVMGLIGEPGIHVLPEGSRKRVGRQYVVLGVTRDRKPDLRPTVDDADHRIPDAAKILMLDARILDEGFLDQGLHGTRRQSCRRHRLGLCVAPSST